MAKQPNEKTADGAALRSMKPPFTLKPSRQLCLALGGMMGLTFAGAGGLYAWQKDQIAQISQKVATREEEARASERAAAQLSGLLDNQAQMRAELRSLETSVTAGEYVPTPLRQTEPLPKSVHL